MAFLGYFRAVICHEAPSPCIPRPDPTLEQNTIRLSGSVPSAVNPPGGCRFHTRCPFKIDGTCDVDEPPVRDMGHGHKIVCHLPAEELYNIKP